MSDIGLVIASAAIGAAVSFAGSVLVTALESRRKIDDAIREKRLEHYAALWKKTGLVPLWPRARVTHAQLFALCAEFREWYFGGGGMYLSAQSRKVYGETQTMLDSYQGSEGELDGDYARVQKQLNALRSSLTVDLASRTRTFASPGGRDA